MPTYVYRCDHCEEKQIERIVAIEERDRQCCRNCGTKLEREIVFTGLTWAPTAGGYR